MKPNIVYCCPTRSKPEYVDQFVSISIDKSRLPDTVFVLGIDEDERELYEEKCKLIQNKELIKDGKLKVVTFPRPDSLGEKFNLIAASEPNADAYIMGVDDLSIHTIAWDLHVNDLACAFPDGVGVVQFGRQWNEPALPAFQMCTKQWCELQGFFMAPYFPFWWHDTWNLEMTTFLGRGLYLDIDVQHPPQSQEPMTPRRDLQFWALFFDFMRPARLETARRMMKEMEIPNYLKYQLMTKWTELCVGFEHGNSKLRDPLFVMRWQQGRVTDVEDERHKRLKARAHALMAENSEREVVVEPALSEAAE